MAEKPQNGRRTDACVGRRAGAHTLRVNYVNDHFTLRTVFDRQNGSPVLCMAILRCWQNKCFANVNDAPGMRYAMMMLAAMLSGC